MPKPHQTSHSWGRGLSRAVEGGLLLRESYLHCSGGTVPLELIDLYAHDLTQEVKMFTLYKHVQT